MPNKYLTNLLSAIKQYEGETLSQFHGVDGQRAEFDDFIWYYHSPISGRKTKYLAFKYQGGITVGVDSLSVDHAFSYPYSHLVKIWIIDVSNMAVSERHKIQLVAGCRKFLTLMEGELYQQTAESIRTFYSTKRMPAFLGFCFDSELLPRFKLPSEKYRDRTGAVGIQKKLDKMPTSESLMALGAIFAKTFIGVNQNGVVKPGEIVCLPDALITTFCLLSLASPNRMGAELAVLPKQRLGKYALGETTGMPEGKAANPTVYYLNWVGSKGFKENKNHVLSALSDYIEKAINYFYLECEAARVLCRFYENPNLKLDVLLGEFQVEKSRLDRLRLKEKTNLFQLGYALGFYDFDASVYVLRKEYIGQEWTHFHDSRKRYCEKKIYLLTMTDVVSTTRAPSAVFNSMDVLMGAKSNDRYIEGLTATIKEVQSWWINHNTTVLIPEFPISYSSGESSIDIKDALFCVLGSKLGRKKSPVRYHSTFYSVLSLNHLSDYVSGRLYGTNDKLASVFEGHGYSSEMNIKPHSLRHYLNTLADKSAIPIEIITAWSGRLSSEQTHTYIHTSDDEKADKIRAIVNKPDGGGKHIRVVSAERLEYELNYPASITSTGVCNQDTYMTPCDYINDFVSQCHMCEESCYVAGDEEAIAFLEKDFTVQTRRIAIIEKDTRIINSMAMQQWFIIHSRNTSVLSSLIALMKEYPSGTIIRYAESDDSFMLVDLDTNKITEHSHVIPDFQEELKIALTNLAVKCDVEGNQALEKVLSKFVDTEV